MGNSHHDLVGVFPAGDESSIALTEPHLRFPTDVLDDFRLVGEPQVQVATDLGRGARGPGAVDQDASGMGGAGLGERSLATLCTAGGFRRNQAHTLHQCPRAFKPCQVPHVCHQGDSHRKWPPTQSRESLDHGGQTPGADLLVEFLVETLEACAVFVHGSDIFLDNDLWRRRGTDDLREPPEVGRAPMRPAHVPAVVSAQKGCETERGVFAIAEGICRRAGEGANRCSFDRGDIDHREVAGTGQSGELHSVSAVGCDPVTGFLGEQRGGHHPAIVSVSGQRAIEPVATGAGFRDKDQMCGCGWHRTDQLIEVTLAGAHGSQVHDCGAVVLRHIGNRDGVLVNVHADAACGRLRQS